MDKGQRVWMILLALATLISGITIIFLGILVARIIPDATCLVHRLYLILLSATLAGIGFTIDILATLFFGIAFSDKDENLPKWIDTFFYSQFSKTWAVISSIGCLVSAIATACITVFPTS